MKSLNPLVNIVENDIWEDFDRQNF